MRLLQAQMIACPDSLVGQQLPTNGLPVISEKVLMELIVKSQSKEGTKKRKIPPASDLSILPTSKKSKLEIPN
jgi:hypothetical protein